MKSDPVPTGADVPDDDEPIIHTCWCGATGTYEQLFDNSGLPHGCGATGYVECECGGDLCVCHHHGETECPGCPECEDDDEDDLRDCGYDYYGDEEDDE